MNVADTLKKQLEIAHQNGSSEMEKRSLLQRHISALMFQHVFTGQPIPRHIAILLGEGLSFLSTGNRCPALEPSKPSNSKRAKRSPWEMMCISSAVHYLQLVEEGVIHDPKPTESVQQAFGGSDSMKGGVTKRTIQKWAKEPLPIEYMRTSDDVEKITCEMKAAGKMYSEAFSLKAKATQSGYEH
jgi:hypothetical protein